MGKIIEHRSDSVMTWSAKLRTRPVTPMSLFCKDIVTQRWNTLSHDNPAHPVNPSPQNPKDLQ